MLFLPERCNFVSVSLMKIYSNEHNKCFYLFFNVELEIYENFYTLIILVLIIASIIDLLQKLYRESQQ